jgi:hypothetical protein
MTRFTERSLSSFLEARWLRAAGRMGKKTIAHAEALATPFFRRGIDFFGRCSDGAQWLDHQPSRDASI